VPTDAHRADLPHAWLILIGLLILIEQVVLGPAVWWSSVLPGSEAVTALAKWSQATMRRREFFLAILVALGLIGLWWRGAATLRLVGAPLVAGWVLAVVAALLGVIVERWSVPSLEGPDHVVAITLTLGCTLLMWIVAGRRMFWALVGTLWALVGLFRHIDGIAAMESGQSSHVWLGLADISGLLGILLAAGVALTEGWTDRRRRWSHWALLAVTLVATLIWHFSLARGGIARGILGDLLGWQANWPSLLHSLAFLAALLTFGELLHRRRLRWALWALAVWIVIGSQVSALTRLEGLWAILAWTIVVGWAEETGRNDDQLPSYLS
jgi:hypothetical protein